jgi:hypothetical protein
MGNQSPRAWILNEILKIILQGDIYRKRGEREFLDVFFFNFKNKSLNPFPLLLLQ